VVNLRPYHRSYDISSYIPPATYQLTDAKGNENNALITKADKGNSITTVYKTNYQENVMDFINSNPSKISNTDQTHTFQKEIRRSINNSKVLLNKNDI
jgi:hypothetical protein